MPYTTLKSGCTYMFIYDGTNYQLIGDLNTNIITGVKGGNESDFRTGNINITKAHIGLGSVDNTADADKKVAQAEKAIKNL